MMRVLGATVLAILAIIAFVVAGVIAGWIGMAVVMVGVLMFAWATSRS